MEAKTVKEKRPPRPKTIELNHGGDVKTFPYRPEATVNEVLEYAIRIFGLAAQVHQLGLFLKGKQLEPTATLKEAGVKPGDRLVVRQTVVQGG